MEGHVMAPANWKILMADRVAIVSAKVAYWTTQLTRGIRLYSLFSYSTFVMVIHITFIHLLKVKTKTFKSKQ